MKTIKTILLALAFLGSTPTCSAGYLESFGTACKQFTVAFTVHRATRELRALLYQHYLDSHGPSAAITKIGTALFAREATNYMHQQISTESYYYTHVIAGLCAWLPMRKDEINEKTII